MKKFITLFLIVMLMFTAVGCDNAATNTSENATTNETSNATEEVTNNETTNNEATEDATEEATEEQPQIIENPIDVTTLSEDNRPLVTIALENGSEIKLALVPEIAPNTVNSFISLIEDNYYDGLIFHRIIKDFMIQGGDPQGTGTGGPGYTIADEFFIYDESTLTVTFLPHYRGILSMAKTQAPDSAGSQFFIVQQDAHFLNGQYAAFGYVLEGLDVIDALAAVETNEADKPLEDVVIKTITVDLNGYEAAEPVVIQ